MKCKDCGVKTKVLDTRFVKRQHLVRRRRECVVCDKRFTSYEIRREQLESLYVAAARSTKHIRQIANELRASLIGATDKEAARWREHVCAVSKTRRRLRNEAIVSRASLGESYASLGREFGLSRERVRQIVATGATELTELFEDKFISAGFDPAIAKRMGKRAAGE